MSQPSPPPAQPTSAPPPAKYWTRTALVLAAVLLLAGGWVLLSSLGVHLPPLSRHWPLFLIAGGIASIADWALISKRAGALGRGVFAIALGVDLYLVALHRIPWLQRVLWTYRTTPPCWLAGFWKHLPPGWQSRMRRTLAWATGLRARS